MTVVKITLNRKRKALVALLVVLVFGVAFAWYFTPDDPYLTVSDVVLHSEKHDGKTIEVRGTVEDGTLNYDTRKFNLTDGKESLNIVSDAQIPDNLNEGKECVVKGELAILEGGELEFHTSEITVGCPSKYE